MFTISRRKKQREQKRGQQQQRRQQHIGEHQRTRLVKLGEDSLQERELGGGREDLDEATKKYYDEYKKLRNCIANSVPDSIIVPVLQYFIPIFVSKLVEVRKQVEQERELILGWNITIDRSKEDVETQQSVPDISSSNRKRVRTDVDDSANERPTIRRKLDEGAFMSRRSVFF